MKFELLKKKNPESPLGFACYISANPANFCLPRWCEIRSLLIKSQQKIGLDFKK